MKKSNDKKAYAIMSPKISPTTNMPTPYLLIIFNMVTIRPFQNQLSYFSSPAIYFFVLTSSMMHPYHHEKDKVNIQCK